MSTANWRYILNDKGEPELCPDLLKWGRWFEAPENRIVAQDRLENGVFVSTVFLGLDHAFFGGPPVLWETMMFGGPHGDYQVRYTSREEALRGHAEAVMLAKLGLEEEAGRDVDFLKALGIECKPNS